MSPIGFLSVARWLLGDQELLLCKGFHYRMRMADLGVSEVLLVSRMALLGLKRPLTTGISEVRSPTNPLMLLLFHLDGGEKSLPGAAGMSTNSIASCFCLNCENKLRIPFIQYTSHVVFQEFHHNCKATKC